MSAVWAADIDRFNALDSSSGAAAEGGVTKIGKREGMQGKGAPVGGGEGGRAFVHGQPNDDWCPKHGSRYVIRSGTNRCPKGRKLGVNCR